MASENERENEKRETVADIVAEIRRDIKLGNNYYAANIPNRIEAAWKRESRAIATEHAVLPAVCITRPAGNEAAIREALESARNWCLNRLYNASYQVTVEGLLSIINAALSAPARNCDVYDPDRAAHMMEVSYCSQMSPSHCDGTNCTRCSFKWFTSPAEKGGAK